MIVTAKRFTLRVLFDKSLKISQVKVTENVMNAAVLR